MSKKSIASIYMQIIPIGFNEKDFYDSQEDYKKIKSLKNFNLPIDEIVKLSFDSNQTVALKARQHPKYFPYKIKWIREQGLKELPESYQEKMFELFHQN